MFTITSLLIIIILVFPFPSSLANFSKYTGNIIHSFNGTLKPKFPEPCLELQDKSILYLKAFNKIISVTCKPQGSSLRKFNGFHSRILKDNADSSSYFASGFLPREFIKNNNLTFGPLVKQQAKKPLTELRNLCAKNYSLKLIGDHTVLRNVDNGDIGITLSFMTPFGQEVNILIPAVDFESSGLTCQISLRVNDIIVFQDQAAPTIYPLHNMSFNSIQIKHKTVALKDPRVCYDVMFTSRQFLENSPVKSHLWSNETTRKEGICAADDKHVDMTNLSCLVCQNLTNVMDSNFPPPSNLWKSLNATEVPSCSPKDIKQVLVRRTQCFGSALPASGQIAQDYDY